MLEEGTEHELLLFPSVRRLYCFLDSHLSPIVCVDLKEVVVVFMVPGACCLSLLQYETEERGMRWKSVRHIFHCFAKWYNKFSHNFHCEDICSSFVPCFTSCFTRSVVTQVTTLHQLKLFGPTLLVTRSITPHHLFLMLQISAGYLRLSKIRTFWIQIDVYNSRHV